MDETRWVPRAQCGDREALESLLRGTYPWLGRYLNSVVGPDDADDVLQDVLILVCRRLGSLRSPHLFHA
jgi:DNA-directed RNA polymerase specialized sigma24 family protein